MICSSGRSKTSMGDVLGMLDKRNGSGSRNEMGSDPRFVSGVVCQAGRPMFHWGCAQSETKRVFFRVSLGKCRASPPRIRSRTGGTRSFSMGYAVQHFEQRQFFSENRSPFALLQTTHHHARTSRLTTHIPTRRRKCLELFFTDAIFFSERRIIGTREVNHLLH